VDGYSSSDAPVAGVEMAQALGPLLVEPVAGRLHEHEVLVQLVDRHRLGVVEQRDHDLLRDASKSLSPIHAPFLRGGCDKKYPNRGLWREFLRFLQIR